MPGTTNVGSQSDSHFRGWLQVDTSNSRCSAQTWRRFELAPGRFVPVRGHRQDGKSRLIEEFTDRTGSVDLPPAQPKRTPETAEDHFG